MSAARESTVSLANAQNALKRLVTEPIRKPESPLVLLSKLTIRQWLVFLAAFAGWALDAMDYFLLTLAVADISKEFNTTDSAVTSAITLTLLLRPVGALIFGLAGDKWGRRYPLMFNVIMYSVLELATGFVPNFATFLGVRSLFGIAMGGEWGLGASLAMEAIPAECRGLFSGILQQGYATGNLLSTGIFSLVYMYYPNNWRVLFYVGCFPAVLIIIIRFAVPESEAYHNQQKRRDATQSNFLRDLGVTMRLYWPRAIEYIAPAGIQTAGFFMQFLVQGAWGCVPSYLTEISPPAIRATFPGLVYNTGNMISAASAQIEATIADNYPTKDYKGAPVPNYALTQAIFIGCTVVCLIVTIAIGVEDRDANLVTGELQVTVIDENEKASKAKLMGDDDTV
ncbi:hypothetical protein HDU93_008510 [Gonapodya sp. JEL0774]|nr:hypothetical protein HDU93_008510 [Gonapodya sp. JEL0774]